MTYHAVGICGRQGNGEPVAQTSNKALSIAGNLVSKCQEQDISQNGGAIMYSNRSSKRKVKSNIPSP